MWAHLSLVDVEGKLVRLEHKELQKITKHKSGRSTVAFCRGFMCMTLNKCSEDNPCN